MSSKRILVTGASRGIGRGAAVALARKGHRVVLAARNEVALREAAGAIASEGGMAEIAVMDLTRPQSVESAIAGLLRAGPVDVVINNAGTCIQREFIVGDEASLRAEFELNYWGAQRVARAVLPSMIRRRSGLIVNVSSLLGTIACPTTANYSASKAALEAWTQALRGEVGRFGVHVGVFMAPHTQTELGKQTGFEGVVSLPVDYVAKELIRAVERRPRYYAASPVYRMLLRINTVLPSFMERQVAASVRSKLLADPLMSSAAARMSNRTLDERL